MALAGPPVNLLGLLSILDGRPLIQKKARSLVIGSPLADIPGFNKLLAEWPGPITIVSEELRNLKFPAAALEEDFAWAANHPVMDAYRAAQTLPYDPPIGAMVAVLHAVHPEANHFALSKSGTLTVLPDGRTQFNETPQGRHRLLMSDPGRTEPLIAALRQIVATRPEGRRGGRGG
jgi:hypothetical protein